MVVAYAETRDLPLDRLTKFPGNARRGDVDEIRASIRRHGQYRSLVVRDDNGTLVILAGNHTFEAIRAEGQATARCEIVTCTDDEARRVNIADNRLAELGDYDTDALVELLSYLDDDYAGTGWTDEDVQFLIDPPATDLPPALSGADDVPDAPAQPVTKPGDLWLLGPHRLLCGDATDMAAVEAMLGGGRADCMWTDPPYGVDYVGKTKDALTIRNDSGGGSPRTSGWRVCGRHRRASVRRPSLRSPPARPDLSGLRGGHQPGWLVATPATHLGQRRHGSRPLRLPLPARAGLDGLHRRRDRSTWPGWGPLAWRPLADQRVRDSQTAA